MSRFCAFFSSSGRSSDNLKPLYNKLFCAPNDKMSLDIIQLWIREEYSQIFIRQVRGWLRCLAVGARWYGEQGRLEKEARSFVGPRRPKLREIELYGVASKFVVRENRDWFEFILLGFRPPPSAPNEHFRACSNEISIYPRNPTAVAAGREINCSPIRTSHATARERSTPDVLLQKNAIEFGRASLLTTRNHHFVWQQFVRIIKE